MSDDLHERRITDMDWPRAARHMEARLDDLLAKFAKLAADHEETWEGLQELDLVNTKGRVLSHEVRIAALEGK